MRLFFPGRTTQARGRGSQDLPKTSHWKPRLVPLRRDRVTGDAGRSDRFATQTTTPTPPYRFARIGIESGGFLDLSQDTDVERLEQFGLPEFSTPEELADWLDLPVGRLAWLANCFSHNHRPENEQQAHYHYHWIRKRTAGFRLIEAPKQTLKSVQHTILREILDRVPTHPSAHGFVSGRSIVTNASPHVGRRVLIKFDLQNFYATVRFARVVAVFRSIGYCREAAIWLARLTTSALPPNIPFPNGDSYAILPYLPAHLPQGAPTSPALANLSAFGLDVRLSGLSRSFGVRYTRYADDLTFSGSDRLLGSLWMFIPFVTKIIRTERFRVHPGKRKVVRNNQRQTVTGVVVNERTNVSRKDYDRLKAILTNSIRHGPASQNRQEHADFAAQLRGKIAHVQQLNSDRGARLLALYRQIDWGR